MGRAKAHGLLIIRAHTHGQAAQIVAFGDLAQQREVRCGVVIHGRNAHQAGKREAKLLPALMNKPVRRARHDTRLLIFLAGIDLYEQGWAFAGLVHLGREFPRQLGPIDGMNNVEQRHGLGDLVGLEWPDQMQRHIREGGAQVRPFAHGLLHPVLAEIPLARFQNGPDRISIKGFRDRDQGHLIRLTPRGLCGGGNLLLYLGEGRGGVGHGKGLGLEAGKHGKLAEVARALNADHPEGTGAGRRLPPLFFFTDEARAPDPLHILERLPPDCGVVFRHYGAADRLGLARAVVAACRQDGRLCLVAGDEEFAAEAAADGLHVPEHVLRMLTDRPNLALVTAAAHSADALTNAANLGLDAAFLSPVFATRSHRDAKPLGAPKFAEIVAAARIPVYALGGVTDETASRLEASGAVGIAAIGAFLD